LLRRVYHLDACLDAKKNHELLTERQFKTESHYARFKREPADEEWIPIIKDDGSIILTSDRNGDGVLFKVLQTVQPYVILVSPTLQHQPAKLVDLLEKHQRRIESAFERVGPLVIWLSVNNCQASWHGDYKTRLAILGNGKLRS
jgi:hypothetical protein